MASRVCELWQAKFLEAIQQPWVAEDLKCAALTEDLMKWTSTLTTAVVRSCEALGWSATAKGHLSSRLPKAGQEYLSIDVMGFPPADEDSSRWPWPLAAFELENSASDDRVAYSLWKVLCVRAPLRVVIAYRPDWEQSRKLVGALAEDVIGGLAPGERSAIGGETVVIVGNRGDGETFPWGYFKFWMLDANVGRFDKIQ